MENYFSVRMTAAEVNQLSALELAHCGDAVFELLVRSRLCTCGSTNVKNLHRRTVSFVSAGAQARRVERLLPLLTEQETAWYKRGRNANVHTVPKAATQGEYARATGLECLFGALFLTGQADRANELFVLTMEDDHGV